MRILNTYEQAYEHKPFCIALGSFDGVHVGHQKLIEKLKYNANLFRCASMIYTFGVHPRKILRPGRPFQMITNNSQRTDIITKKGVDVLFLESFDKVMNLDAEQFFCDILIGRFNAKCVIVGYNFKFGRKNEGDAEKLLELGGKYNVKIEVVPPVVVNDEVVSSTLIRHMIRSGQVDEVPIYLGKSYSIQGNVIHGKKNGLLMGIRTANIEADPDVVRPHKGVYISNTIIDGILYKSITNIGVNPTFNGDKLSIETHVLDFEGDLYGKTIEVCFLRRIRDEMLFNCMEDLIHQIKKDIEARLQYD